MNRFKDKNDETLVELTLLGNDKAYEELVTRYGKLVTSVAYRVTGNRFSSEDAAQDAFVFAWMKLDTLRERSKFSAWVSKIARNTARNIMFHYQNTVPDLSLDVVSYFESDDSDDPEVAIIADSEGEELREAVESLTEKIRETVKLHYFDGYSVKEIAEMLSLPAGTVKWRLSEGRKQLRKGYGVMEKTIYDENETLETRVLRQVNELKKWRRRNDKSGFEKEYREVLAAVDSLSDADKKNFALAEVLLLGYWFVPGERNDETLSRIKEAAEASHNDEIMQGVVGCENDKYGGEDKLNFMREKIEALREGGYRLALGYEIFWYARELLKTGRRDEAIGELHKVMEVLEPSDVYYAIAAASLKGEELRGAVNMCDETVQVVEIGGVIERDADKLCLYDHSGCGWSNYSDNLFMDLSLCDGIILDTSLKPGESFVSSDGKLTYTVKSDSETVTVPAGTFEGCTLIEVCGFHHTEPITLEALFAPGVGIVKQQVEYFGKGEWELSEYSCVKGGSHELLPLDAGNRWEYALTANDGLFKDVKSVFEVTFADSVRAVFSHHACVKITGYDKSTVMGNAAFIRQNYFKMVDENDGALCNRDEIYASLDLMQKAAKTDYEKKYAAVCADVTRRIFETDREANPDYTEKGLWNFFGTYCVIEAEHGKKICDFGTHIELKDTDTMDFDGTKLLHAFLLEIWPQAAGNCLWDDKFVPGYCEKKDEDSIYGNTIHRELTVCADEDITTAAGKFTGCRHIHVQLDGLPWGFAYQGGNMDFWFAPGVGLARYSRATDSERDNVFDLVSYTGIGEGYFPVEAGLFRRYEPTDLRYGWHSFVEHTYEEQDGKVNIIYNILGTRDRKEYEESLKRLGIE